MKSTKIKHFIQFKKVWYQISNISMHTINDGFMMELALALKNLKSLRIEE
jgi:hypothetical protein